MNWNKNEAINIVLIKNPVITIELIFVLLMVALLINYETGINRKIVLNNFQKLNNITVINKEPFLKCS